MAKASQRILDLMQLISLFMNRVQSGPSLRHYFDDVTLQAEYMDRIKKSFAKASEPYHFITDNGDLYKEIPRQKTMPKIQMEVLPTDQLDAAESFALIENNDRNHVVKRDFPKNLRRRRVPKLQYYNDATSTTNVIDTEDGKNRKLIEAIERNTKETVESLLKSGINPNLTYTLTTRQAEDLRLTIGNNNEDATWTVLHEASSRGHWQCVGLLLTAGADPNASGVKDLTPLDVAGSSFYYNHHKMTDSLPKVIKMLLDAGGKFNTMKGIDDNLDTPLHTAAEIKSVQSIKLLLDAGACVSCLNTAGLTPLHICLQTKSAEVLDVLVNYKRRSTLEYLERVDVTDSCGFTILQATVILNWVAGFRIVLDAGAELTYSTKHSKLRLWSSPKWYQLLQSRQTPIHLAVARNNIEILDLMLSKVLECNALNCFNQDGETPLFTAIKQGHIGCVKSLIFEGASITEVSVKNHNALHVAAEYDQTEILKFLLEYKDETEHIINNYNYQGCAPLHYAAMNNNPECIKILLQNQADVRLKTHSNAMTPLHIAAGYNYTNVANVIMTYDKTTIDEVDKRGFYPLHVAAYNCCHDVMLLILSYGATLSSSTRALSKKSQTAIEMVTNKFPNPTLFLEEVFDSCISSEDAFGMTKITVNYEVLGKINEVHQMEVIEELVRCGQQKILIHPLLESLLSLKWQTLLPFFYIILATYAFFVLSLNILVVSVFYYNDKKENAPLFLQRTAWVVVVYISICLLLLQEFFYIHVKRSRYFRYLETWVKLTSICMAAILGGTILCHSSWSESEWPRHVATLALLLSWVEIMFLLSRFPSWGYYVLMFGNVSVTIIKILLTFIFLVVAFSFSFMIQFQSTPPFDDLWASLIKTMVMMTSEFDYVSLFNNDNLRDLSSSKTIVRLLFLVFLLFVSIVFMNFMVGVAVSDINNLNIQGNTKRMGKLVELLSTLDVVIHDGPLRKLLPRKTFDTIRNKRFLHKITTFPGTEKTWAINCGDRMNKLDYETDCKVTLPKSLRNCIMNKAKKQKQQEENDSIHKAYMNKIDLLFEAVTRGEPPVTRTVLESTMNVLHEKVETMSSEIAEMKLIHSEMLKNLEEILLKSH